MKTFWTVIISVILTAGVAGGGVYYFLNKQATTDKNSLNSQISDLQTQISNLKKTTTSTTTTATASTTTDPTTNWKTYTNTTYGFRFKYPKEWTVEEGASASLSQRIVSVKSDQPNSSKIWPGPGSVHYFDQVIVNKEKETTIKSWINTRLAAGQTDSSKIVDLNGENFTEIVIQADPSYLAELILNNSNLFSIVFDWASAKSDISETQSQILSTFQFTK